MRTFFTQALAGIATTGLLLGAVHAQPTWQVMVPAPWARGGEDVAQVFTKRLKDNQHTPIPLQAKLSYQGPESLAAALRQPGPPYNLVLMNEELALVGQAAQHSPQHLSHYATLLVVLETRWCLFVRADSPITHPHQLLPWAREKSTAPRIAIPTTSGRVRLWVQGMAQRTGRA